MEINPVLQKKKKENVVNNSLVENVNYLPCCTIGTVDQGDQMLRRKMIIVIQLMPRALRSSGDTQVAQKRSAVQYCCISNFPPMSENKQPRPQCQAKITSSGGVV